MVQLRAGEPFSPALIRHMVLNSIRALNCKFSRDYGPIVICCDSRNYWRKTAFPYYKAKRKKDRDDSGYDWETIFDTLREVKQELVDHMPYVVLDIETAEADDIIGALTKEYGVFHPSDEKILIVSGDKDFIQLQKYSNVYQWSPVMKKMLVTDNPERFLREHIMMGDIGDGIPNFLSDSDTFVTLKRQRPLSRKKIDDWAKIHPTSFCKTPEMKANYERNDMLVNLERIPEELQKEIVQTYKSYKTNPKGKMFNYFVTYRLGEMLSAIQEF